MGKFNENYTEKSDLPPSLRKGLAPSNSRYNDKKRLQGQRQNSDKYMQHTIWYMCIYGCLCVDVDVGMDGWV